MAARPSLWAVGVRQAMRLSPDGWWRRRPYLPVPDRDYLRFRVQTQYGDADHDPEPEDLLAYLRWCRDFPVFRHHSLASLAPFRRAHGRRPKAGAYVLSIDRQSRIGRR
ncbi:MAG: hypothetical protein ACRD29_25005 [Acidimicrobiales bacterium]